MQTLKTMGMKAMTQTFASPTTFQLAGKAGRWVMRHVPFAVNNKLNPWYKQREMPVPPKESFGEWYLKNRKKKDE